MDCRSLLLPNSAFDKTDRVARSFSSSASSFSARDASTALSSFRSRTSARSRALFSRSDAIRSVARTVAARSRSTRSRSHLIVRSRASTIRPAAARRRSSCLRSDAFSSRCLSADRTSAPRSQAISLFSQSISSRCRASIRSLCSWDRRSETRRSATSSSRSLSRRSNPFGAADRSCCFSRAFSSRSNAIVRPSADSETSVRSRATSACKESALLAARRISFVSSTAAFSLVRLLSSCHFREPDRAREATSAQRNSSQRASAASARARSRSARACACSYRDFQSTGSNAGAGRGGDEATAPRRHCRPAPDPRQCPRRKPPCTRR